MMPTSPDDERPPIDDQLAPIIRQVLVGMIDELPPTGALPATGSDPASTRRPSGRTPARIAALAAACVVLVGGLAFVASRDSDPTTTDPSSVPGATNPSRTAPTDSAVASSPTPAGTSIENPLTEGSWSGARTNAAGDQLTLFFVGAAEYQPGDPCSMRYLPTVEESDTEVTVVIHGERPESPDGQTFCRLLGHGRTITVDLSAPLDGRTLIALGAAREVFDGSTLARPTWFPDGWVENDEGPAGFGANRSPAWWRAWAPPHATVGGDACQAGDSGFTLFEGGAELVDVLPPEPGETVIDTYDIGSASATYSIHEARGIARLRWVSGSRGYVLRSSPTCAGAEPPALETMLEFARHLDT